MGKGRITKEELDRRLAETSKLLIRKRSYVDVERTLAAQFDVDKRTARDWIRKVKEQWREQASAQDADEAHDDLVAILDNVIAMAHAHTVIVKDAAGEPILDKAPTLANGQPNPGFMKPLVKSEPRIQYVLHAVSQLRALKGADRPLRAHIKLDADIEAMPDLNAIPEAVQKTLKEELLRLAGGDLRKLAGEWFRDPNAEAKDA